MNKRRLVRNTLNTANTNYTHKQYPAKLREITTVVISKMATNEHKLQINKQQPFENIKQAYIN